MVGALIGKGLCYLGIHKVDDWTYRYSERCIQDGVCQRCGAKQERLPHDWDAPYDQLATCRRCGEGRGPEA